MIIKGNNLLVLYSLYLAYFIEEFKALSLDEQKKLLLEMLEYNDLYVNYSEIDDVIYNVSEEDKKLNKDFMD